MPYVLPTFNLICNIWTGTGTPGVPDQALPMGAPRLSLVPCNLCYGRRVNVASTGGTYTAGIPLLAMNLLLPKLTDIRGAQDDTSNDVVECPSASGRFYWVTFVDDIGKGFSNEHRTAALLAIIGSWGAPYP